MAKKKKSESFEESLQKLEKIVEQMEQGDLPLEKAMEAFTEGIQLVQYCHRKLEEAENTVQKLAQDENGNWTTTPFETPAAESTEQGSR